MADTELGEPQRSFFTKFSKEGAHYKLKDFVLLNQGKAQDEPYIAQIVGIFQDKNAEPFIMVRWIFRPNETLCKPSVSGFNEVFLSNELDVNPVDTIIRKIFVKHKGAISNISEFSAKENHFYYKKSFNPNTGKFTIISDPEEENYKQDTQWSTLVSPYDQISSEEDDDGSSEETSNNNTKSEPREANTRKWKRKNPPPEPSPSKPPTPSKSPNKSPKKSKAVDEAKVSSSATTNKNKDKESAVNPPKSPESAETSTPTSMRRKRPPPQLETRKISKKQR